MFVFLLLAILFPLQIFAGIWDFDNRFYVTDEMWAQDPYNKFVYFETMSQAGKELVPSGHCTAQYISPNLILSAGHCTDADADGYRVKNYKKEEFLVKLIETPFEGKVENLGDWAVFLITDPQYYSDSFFDFTEPTQDVNTISVGYGWMRILTKENLSNIRRFLSDRSRISRFIDLFRDSDVVLDYISNALNKEGEDCLKRAEIKMNGCAGISDKQKQSACYTESNNDLKICSQQGYGLIDNDNRLKASKCQVLYKDAKKFPFPEIMKTTCIIWQGNSGGAVASDDGKSIYGLVSFGKQSGIKDNTEVENFIATTHQFKQRIKKLIKLYDSNNSVEQNIAKIPKNVFVGSNNTSTDSEIKQLKFVNIDSRIQKLEKEKSIAHEEIAELLKSAPDMTDDEMLFFLDKIVGYQVLSRNIEELQKAYEEAKANEQSLANRTLTALTVAATGIGGMELARGLAEQKADKEAEADMTAYIETMRCTYGDGKQIKAGPEEIELPGGNNQELMKLRNDYFALAKDLKERKEALGIKPGIESEVILDKSEMGLYDDENIGIENGAYSSLYRAKMLESETDQAKINEDKEASKKRVIGGAVAAGVGVVGGAVGNSMINGKLGEMIKENKNKK